MLFSCNTVIIYFYSLIKFSDEVCLFQYSKIVGLITIPLNVIENRKLDIFVYNFLENHKQLFRNSRKSLSIKFRFYKFAWMIFRIQSVLTSIKEPLFVVFINRFSIYLFRIDTKGCMKIQLKFLK